MIAFRYIYIYIYIAICVSFSILSADSKENINQDSTNPQNIESSKEDSKTQIKQYSLNPITTFSNVDKLYQSAAGNISRQMIESNPSGNGDITSILRILPNVQFDNSQLSSNTPGEIAPANISISGGLHYQNLFNIDGINMNNDLGAGYNNLAGGNRRNEGVASQGLSIDTSLLDSINVLDSNIGAAFGGFNGGVVETTLRRPTKKYAARLSYQITQGNAATNAISMTNYHILDSNMQDFLVSTSSSNQPIFIKHLIKSSFESKINDKFSILVAFNTTQSFIPLRAGAQNSNALFQTPADPKDYTRKQTQKRQIYNALIKTYYDVNENLGFELSYIYAPLFDYRYTPGTKDDYYNIESGGHTLGFKSTYVNPLGTLSNTLSYSLLESNTRAIGYVDRKMWQISDSKNWGNVSLGFAYEGSLTPFDSTQHTLSNKIIQDFTPLEFFKTTHRFQVGLDLGYQYAQNGYTQNSFDTGQATYMTQAQAALCAQTDMSWCDTAKAYNPFYTAANKNELINQGILSQITGSNFGVTYNYGQYFNTTTYYRQGNVSLHNIYGALFFQDDISVNLNNYGILNARVGLRLDTDSYMLKVTPGYRFSLTYEAPYYAKDFATQATLGINRYYGRNIFAYALADGLKKLESSLKRDNPNVTWESILESNRQCANANDSNCITGYGVDFMKFSKLNVPYVNEYMIGFLQDIKNFSISLKYIYRQGRDEVRLVSSDVANLPSDSNYQNTYYTYTNEGKSQSHIITLLINNTKPLEFYNVKNYFLFAFDFTHTQRNFRDYADSITAPQLQNQFISYNGVLMRYAERPADNFIKPYTFRLETTHTYEVWRARILWNNFFRLRSSYDAMVSITAGSDGADSFEINGVMTSVDTFKPYRVDMAFTWDMRFGLEFDVGRGNKFFTNLDIYNILDSKNIAIANLSYSSSAGLSATPIYEVGRQFWLEMGYRF